MISVVLVDDEQALRRGIRFILEGAPDIEVVAEASNGRDGVARVTDLRPDVVLMDIRMPVMDGIEAAGQLRASAPDIPVVMLTAFDTDAFIVDALRAGAMGFLLKTIEPEGLVSAVRAAAAEPASSEEPSGAQAARAGAGGRALSAGGLKSARE